MKDITLVFYNKKEYDSIGTHITYFKTVLFKNFNVNIRYNYDILTPNNIFIIWRNYEAFLSIAVNYKQNNIDFAAIHIGRERYESHKTKWYKYAKFVIKKGYNIEYLKIPNVYYMPMGYKIYNKNISEVLNTIKQKMERSYLYNFVGTTGKTSFRAIDRKKLFDKFLNSDTRTNRKVEILSNDKVLTSKQYFTILKKSIFTICPYGNNLETLRHWEAFECGSIPIIKDAPFLNELKNHPFIIINDYSDLFSFFDTVTDEFIKNKQNEIKIWWTNKKNQLSLFYSNLL